MPPPQPTINLSKPVDYFPIVDERYSTRAGLSRFGTDFGNGAQDTQLFQFDNIFNQYRDNKLTVRQQQINDYVCTDAIDAPRLLAVNKWLVQHLCNEHTDKFTLQKSTQGMQLDCRITDEQLKFDTDYHLSTRHNKSYQNLFDALALQVQEDICLMQVTATTAKLLAAHLCAANHWSARDKLGMDMTQLHQPVPEFSDNNQAPDKLLLGIVKKSEPYVRFAWGLCEHATLNQHPSIPPTPGSSANLFMRVERQVLWPIANTDILVFTIRTYFHDCAELKKQQRRSLINAVNSMSEETLEYKKINKESILEKLI